MLTFYLSVIESEYEKTTFTEIYEESALAGYHIALKITKNHTMAEDAVHNGFLSVIKHKDGIFALSREKRKSKVLIIIKNKAIDIMRYENKRSHESLDDGVAIDTTNVFDIIEYQESTDYLIKCLSNLPESYKTVFELRYVHDMSNLEIADLLDISNKSVSTRIARAKVMLQEQLNLNQG